MHRGRDGHGGDYREPGGVKADGYVRVSRVGRRDTGSASYITESVQRDQIQGWAKAHGVQIAEWHLDRDESGSKIDRPAFQAMLARVENGATEGVVVAKLDRFARSLPGALEAIRRIDAAGATFTSVAEGIDPTTPAGKMMHRLMLILAEFELDRITESWATAQQRAIGRGVHFMVPFGYRRPGKGEPLEPDPATAPLVGELFRRRGAGASWGELAAWLNGRAQSPNGGAWTGRTVRHVIDNRVYLGEAYHGRFRNPGAHPPLVDPAEWDAAQSAPGVRPTAVTDLLLTGIIRCAGCRYRLKTDRYGPPGARVRLYRCRGRHGAGECPAPASITAHLADEHVEGLFLQRYGRVAVAASNPSGAGEAARKALAVAEAELDGFVSDLRLRESLGHDRFAAQVELRAQAVRDAQARVQAEEPAGLVVAPETWDQLTVLERRQIVAAGVDAVFLRRTGQAPVGDRLAVVWAGEGGGDLPGPGRVGPIAEFDWPDISAGGSGA